MNEMRISVANILYLHLMVQREQTLEHGKPGWTSAQAGVC